MLRWHCHNMAAAMVMANMAHRITAITRTVMAEVVVATRITVIIKADIISTMVGDTSGIVSRLSVKSIMKCAKYCLNK